MKQVNFIWVGMLNCVTLTFFFKIVNLCYKFPYDLIALTLGLQNTKVIHHKYDVFDVTARLFVYCQNVNIVTSLNGHMLGLF